MSHISGDWQQPPPARRAHDLPDRGSAQRRGFASLAFRVIGALTIVGGSFWITLGVMNYIDISNQEARQAATKKVRPTTWKTFGKAAYEIRDGAVIFSGPDYIFNQLECGSRKSNIGFSIFVERGAEANMELIFLNARLAPVGEPVIQYLGGITNRIAELRTTTRLGAGIIQAIIYSPRNGEIVTFKDPLIECSPME